MGIRASSIEISNEEREYLELQTRARTIQAQTVTRAQILLLRADSVSIDTGYCNNIRCSEVSVLNLRRNLLIVSIGILQK